MKWKVLNELQEFKTYKEQDKKVVFIFSADWCGDCLVLKDYIDEVIDEFGNEFDFVYINRDKFQELFDLLKLKGIPNIVVFQKNEFLGKIGNGLTIYEDQFIDFIETLI